MNSIRRVQAGFGSINFDGASRPKEDHYAHHVGFTMRTVTKHVPSRVLHFSQTSLKSAIPRACHPGIHSHAPLPIPFLKSSDKKTTIQVFSIGIKTDSKRMVSIDGDQVWFIHKGSGLCDTVLGRMRFDAPAYLFIPRSFTYQVHAEHETFMIGMESTDPLEKPKFNWVNNTVPWNDHCLMVPEPYGRENVDTGERGYYVDPAYPVLVKRAGEWTEIVYKETPFACIGFEGYPYPFVLKAKDISLPTLSKEHTDPTSFMTFASSTECRGSPNVGISTFLPHRMHSPPYFHTNIWDEVLFISGNYPARGGILTSGDMSFHPQGFPHGPQSGALSQWGTPREPKDLSYVEMLAVMFESKTPLIPTDAFLKYEIRDYWKSWAETTAPEKR